jgi:hypothetical protein
LTPEQFLERAGNRARTDDLLITNQLLYQLSYAGNNARSVAQSPGRDKRTGYDRERASTVSGSAVSRFLITVLR